MLLLDFEQGYAAPLSQLSRVRNFSYRIRHSLKTPVTSKYLATMPPLILHNVPDDELYVGEDGVTRPYAMLFPGYACLPVF